MSEVAAPAPAAATPAAPSAPSSGASSARAPSAAAAPARKPINPTDFAREYRRAPAVDAAEEREVAPVQAEAPEEAPVEEVPAAVEEVAEALAAGQEAASEGETEETISDLHGVPLQEALGELLEGRIPEGLLEHLTVRVGDDEVRLKDGVLMHRDYTKKSMALADDRRKFDGEKQAFDGEKAEFYGMVQGWKDPQKLYKGLNSLGLPLEDVAMIWAAEYERKQALSPEQRAAEEEFERRQRAFEKQARDLAAQERRIKEAEAAQHEAAVKQTSEQYKGFIRGHLADAFASVGVDLRATSPEQQQLNQAILKQFQTVLGLYWGENQLSKEIVYNAARATADMLGIKKAALVAPAKPAPAAKPAVQPKPAQPKALAGAVSYDPGKASRPAKKPINARSFEAAIRAARRG